MNRILRLFLFLAAAMPCRPAAAYNDYRSHNLDSLERVVARWTPDTVDRASEEELIALNRAYRDLMLGYSQLNAEKGFFYARKALEISRPRGWESANADALRYLGQLFYGREQYDSAMVYYRAALAATDRMAGGAVSPTSPEGYSEREVDDTYSALYGAVGNLYNMMGDIPQAMEYYRKAGEIFDKYGWNESNAVLYYNIGETWVDEGDFQAAEKAYLRSLDYGTAADDSLMVAMARKGLGRLYMEKGRTWKSLRYLHAAEEYYSAHEREEVGFAKENYEYMSAALLAQRKTLMLLVAGAVALLLLTGGVLLLAGKLRVSRKEQSEVAEVLEETLQEIRPAVAVSEREHEILDLLSKGYTTPQIAEGLHLSPETVKWYRKKLLVKFDVANAAELVTKAREGGVI